MPRIAELLSSTLEADSCSFYVYDESATRTVAAFRHGYSRVVFPSSLDSDVLSPSNVPIEAELMRTKRSVRRSTDEDFRRWPMLNSSLREQDDRASDVAVPLVWHGQVHGAAYLWRHGSRSAFTDEEVATAEGVAQIAAMAIVFARQYGNERIQRQQLDALLDVATLAASPHTVEEVLPYLTQAIRSATGADVCLLYVLEEFGDSVVAGYSDGLNKRERWVFDASFGYPVADVPVESRIRRTLEPHLVVDMDLDLAPGSELVIYAREVGLKEILVTPVVYQNEMIGVVYSWYRSSEQSFGTKAIATVQAIANQAGGVISRARMHDASQQHMQETEALLRIGQSVLTTDSLDAVLDEIASALAEAIPYEYSFVGMLNEERKCVTVTRHWGRFPGSLLHHDLPLDGSLTGTAVSSGQILNVADAFSDERTLQFDPEYLPIRSVLIAPLITDSGTIGALYVGRHRAGYFSARQERLMGLLSQQAAVAIERVQARESLALRTRRQTFLATVVDRLVAEDDPLNALPEIARAACGILADGVLIGGASWEHGRVDWIVAEHSDAKMRSTMQAFLCELNRHEFRDAVETSLHMSEVQVVTDERSARLAPYLEPLFSRGLAGQIMVVPMFQPERARGLIVLLETEASAAFDPDVTDMTCFVASRIADALERKQMTRNREALLRASEALNSKMDRAQILDVFHHELHSIVPCDQFYLSVLNPEAGKRDAILAITPFTTIREPSTVPADLGLTGVVLETGSPLFENNAHLRPESFYPYDHEAEFYREHGESAMVAPLIAEGHVIGSLFVGRAGSNRFSRSDFETFLLFAELAASAIHRTTLVEENNRVYRASVEVLAAVVDAKDPTTLEHSRHVARYSRHAAELMGLSTDEVERIELAGLMHDIGKIGIPDHVLSKSEDLTEHELWLIREHPEQGAKILEQHPALTDLVPLVRHHHEWFDGSGYPDGLSGVEIPLGAAIISVADAFDTMTSERTYQPRRSVCDALDELERCANTQFHPDVVERFVRSVRLNPRMVNAGGGASRSRAHRST